MVSRACFSCVFLSPFFGRIWQIRYVRFGPFGRTLTHPVTALASKARLCFCLQRQRCNANAKQISLYSLPKNRYGTLVSTHASKALKGMIQQKPLRSTETSIQTQPGTSIFLHSTKFGGAKHYFGRSKSRITLNAVAKSPIHQE